MLKQDGTEFLDRVDAGATVVAVGRPDIPDDERPGARLKMAVEAMRAEGAFSAVDVPVDEAPSDHVYRGPRIEVGLGERNWKDAAERSREQD